MKTYEDLKMWVHLNVISEYDNFDLHNWDIRQYSQNDMVDILNCMFIHLGLDISECNLFNDKE